MPIAALDESFAFNTAAEQQPTQLILPDADPLERLVGTWVGTGFNAIWRPQQSSSGSDHFLMLNLTRERLSFSRIPGVIPNRGFEQGDIGMTGVTYMDQISDTAGNGMHIEPGIWAVAPGTTDPTIPQSVIRMASIPHGTTILAQGTASTLPAGEPQIPPTNLIPSFINGGASQDFPERSQISQPSQLRTPALPPEIDQALVDDPNSLLRSEVSGLNVTATTMLQVETGPQPIPGGGTANTAFLAGTVAGEEQGNAAANLVSATFWIETVEAQGELPAFMQLQYSQTVLLDFGPLRWPHVTVATLRQTTTGPTPVQPAPPGVGR
jgi:hypothetical protein